VIVLFLFYFLILNHLLERWIPDNLSVGNSSFGDEVFTIEVMEANLCANDNRECIDLCYDRYYILDKQYRTTIVKEIQIISSNFLILFKSTILCLNETGIWSELTAK